MKLSELPMHHAVLIAHNNRTEVAESLWQELAQASVAHRFFNQTILDIDTARNIISWAQTPYNDDKTALISFHTASLPAQNAMLKILEEPKQGVRFILITSNSSNLIPTVLSRTLEIKGKQEDGDYSHAEEFLKASYSGRMKLPIVVELLSRTDEEGRKDRESVRNFILSIAEVLSQAKSLPRYITETIQVASYASDPSASGKALVEYLSLLLPIIK